MKYMNSSNNSEQDLFEYLLEREKMGGRIQLQLWPDEEKHIVRAAKNKCRIEHPHGEFAYFCNIREPFYDNMVDNFHNSYLKQNNDEDDN